MTSEGHHRPHRLASRFNHGAALIYLASRPSATIRETATALGMSHRRTAGIVRELVDAGMLRIEKRGMRNYYHPNFAARFPHPFLAHLPVGLMLGPVVEALAHGPGTDEPAEAGPTDALDRSATAVGRVRSQPCSAGGDDLP